MAAQSYAKCAKCGITSKEDSSLTFHRFPFPSMHGSLKARVWATFCFPNGDWTSDESLKKLYKQHKMLCSNHFDDTSFTSSDRKRLNKFAIPSEAQHILAHLRDEQNNSCKVIHEVQKPASTSEIEIEVIASTSENIIMLNKPNIQDPCSSKSLNDSKESRSRTGILKELDLKKVLELSPKKQKLYKKCRRNISEIMRLRKKFKEVKRSKRSLLSTLTNEDCVSDMLKSNINGSFYLLLQSQLRNVPRKLTGRRWTLDDKVLALSIYKKSSTCYRLLRRLFCLPSVSSLKSLLNKIPLVCGINSQVIETLREITQKRVINDNLCILAFDEMSIRKNLCYNPKLDQIDGYQDHAKQGRTAEIASHALTFMAIGIRKYWKQPIAFYFSGANVRADRLAVLIKEVLKACFDAGLQVVGTVCDMDGVNIRAINSLGSTKLQPYFYYEGHEIVTVLDPPHLLKCFRNNFLKHDIQYTQDLQIEGKQIQGLAKWCHIEEFFEKDRLNPNFVFAPALTPQHLRPNGKQKMKVRLAAQVLSHSVAAGIFAKVALNELPSDALATATLISNMDKLFDCVNGDSADKKRGKEHLMNMSSTSPHITYFKKMRAFINDLKFVGARNKPPSQEGWLRTLNAIEKIYKNLTIQYNIRTLSVRRLNQDPLENCFGCIRSNCGCNPNPTSAQFVAALKTSLVTNLINNNKNRNCLDDKNDLLHNFKTFLEKKSDLSSSTSSPVPLVNVESVEDVDISQCSGEIQACAYVCGFILKNMKTECITCKDVMLADKNTEIFHSFTSFKEYDEKFRLKYVQYNFCQTVESAANLINNYLQENSHISQIKLNLYKICLNINTEWLKKCEEHYNENVEKIINNTIAICIKRFCILKNQGFVEEASKQALKRKIQTLKHI